MDNENASVDRDRAPRWWRPGPGWSSARPACSCPRRGTRRRPNDPHERLQDRTPQRNRKQRNKNNNKDNNRNQINGLDTGRLLDADGDGR